MQMEATVQDPPRVRRAGLTRESVPTAWPALFPALSSGKPSPTAPAELHLDSPSRHPEWLLFQWSFHALGLSDEAVELLWLELLKGVKHQERINTRLRQHRLSGRGGAIPRLALYNGHFQRVAEALGPSLRLEAGQGPVALWTGGVEVGAYARLRGYSTVEGTRAGRALWRLELYREPRAVVPLYRYLAREFVRQNPRGDVHVFLRAHDPLGALYRRRLPVVDKAAPSRPTTWHPVSREDLRILKEVLEA